MNKIFQFHCDPGHAWLEVNIHTLTSVGLEPQDFTDYSYRDGDVLYLEEDCDAPKFLGKWSQMHGKPDICESYTNSDSRIRSLPRIW